MADALVIWRDGRADGLLREHRGRLSLSYARDARPISLSMPVRSSAYGDQVVRPWFRGLLPEGQTRLTIAYDLGVDADDDMALLRALGNDCAGALSLRPVDAGPPDAGPPDAGPPDADQIGSPLNESEIAALLRALPSSPMGFGAGFRVSLPGMQPKLLLTRTADGWSRPNEIPSTHILKPPVAGLDATTVENEAYCQWLASASGLPAATTSVAHFDGVKVLVSQRFDRTNPPLPVRRIHQEDGCQALAIDPRWKYQTDTDGPSLRAIAKTLSNHGGDVGPLLRLATFTVAIGNADWHGKNVSLVYADDDSISVAPIYDAMSTRLYDTSAVGQRVERTLGMYIGGNADIDDVAADDLAEEGRSWGMSPRRSARIVHETIAAVRAALDTVEAPIEALRELVGRRTERLGAVGLP